MIVLKTKVFSHLTISTIWFADRPNTLNCLNSHYKQCIHQKSTLGFQRIPFFTKLINLNKDITEIEQELSPKTAYEIRRAIKDGVNVTIEHNIDHFTKFYNEFATTKQLQPISAKLKNYKANLIITKAVFDHKDIVMHAYVCDHDAKRVRLLHSASHFRNENDTAYRATVGRANRLLHFNDICLFKQQGFIYYDLGGYALNTKDNALNCINKFKDGFGGMLVEESDFLPITGLLLSFITKLWKHLP